MEHRLFVATATLVLTVVLFLASLLDSFPVHRFPVSWFCFECGIIGGFVSHQQRLKHLSDQELSFLSRSWASILVVPLFGGIFALVFYLLTLSGLLQGALFPMYSVPDFDNPVSAENLTRFFTETYPASGQDFAKLGFWSFASGFSERLVPDILDDMVNRAKAQDSNPSDTQ